MDNYIMLNGKKIELTEEQIKILTEVKEEKKNVIHRVSVRDEYLFINGIFNVFKITEDKDEHDKDSFEKGNYYPPECEDLAIQDALHDELKSRLRKFTRNNGWNEDVWRDNRIKKYFIAHDKIEDKRGAIFTWRFKCNEVYFMSKEIAERAIEEVIEPFENAHPDFVW